MTFSVPGAGGYLGSVVSRRWAELGATFTNDGPDYIINCIRPDNLLLSEHWAREARLIQPSSDAVNEDTDYAVGKRILERTPGAVVIRAGIVDTRHEPEVGYRNWRCNPLTPLEWADFAWSVRDRPGVHTVGRETVTRFEVIDTVAGVFGRPRPVAAWSDEPKDRIVNNEWTEWPTLEAALVEFREWLQS